MNRLALALIGLTLWVDVCLVTGVAFTGSYGRAKVAAVIQLGDYSIDSTAPGGASLILFIAFWTGSLAILGLWAMLRPRGEVRLKRKF